MVDLPHNISQMYQGTKAAQNRKDLQTMQALDFDILGAFEPGRYLPMLVKKTVKSQHPAQLQPTFPNLQSYFAPTRSWLLPSR